jgi:hypothetical protein
MARQFGMVVQQTYSENMDLDDVVWSGGEEISAVYGGLIRIGTFTVSLRIVAKRVSFLEIHTPPDDFMFHLWCLVLAFQWFHPDLINVSPFAGQGNHVTRQDFDVEFRWNTLAQHPHKNYMSRSLGSLSISLLRLLRSQDSIGRIGRCSTSIIFISLTFTWFDDLLPRSRSHFHYPKRFEMILLWVIL